MALRVTDHAWRLGTRRQPGGRRQQPQTYYRGECTMCVSWGQWRVDPTAAQDDYVIHVRRGRWPVRRRSPVAP